ncbi:MAG: hypothetical protein GY757_13210, partial [bacterium]|nr:hypothetical protein [bacterium]
MSLSQLLSGALSQVPVGKEFALFGNSIEAGPVNPFKNLIFSGISRLKRIDRPGFAFAAAGLLITTNRRIGIRARNCQPGACAVLFLLRAPFLFCREEREEPRRKDSRVCPDRQDAFRVLFLFCREEREGPRRKDSRVCPYLFSLIFCQSSRKGTPAIAFISILSDRQDAFGVLFFICREEREGPRRNNQKCVYVIFSYTRIEAGPGNSFKHLTTSSLNHLMRVVVTGFDPSNKISRNHISTGRKGILMVSLPIVTRLQSGAFAILFLC